MVWGIQERYLDCLTAGLCRLSCSEAEASGLTSGRYNEHIAIEGQAERALVHDVFATPFRPVAFSPEW